MPIGLDNKKIKLRKLIEESAGKRLPSERELAREFEISRPVIRSILADLETEGLIQRRQGSGTFVTNHQTDGLQRVSLLVDQEIKLGDDPFFSLLLEQVQTYLQKEGIKSILERIGKNIQFESLKQSAITFGMAGKNVIERLHPDDPPVVGIFAEADLQSNIRISTFDLDDEKAGEEAARHLLDLGCRELIFIGNQTIPASLKRLIGVKKVVEKAGNNLEIIGCHQNYNAGLNLGRQLSLSARAAPFGIIATNDWLALGVRSGLVEKTATNLPLRIVSFDGLSITDDPFLNIDSFAAPIHTIAEDVVSELLRLNRSKTAVGRNISYRFFRPHRS